MTNKFFFSIRIVENVQFTNKLEENCDDTQTRVKIYRVSQQTFYSIRNREKL